MSSKTPYSDVISEVAKQCALSDSSVKAVFSALGAFVAEQLRQGNSVNFPSLGVFKPTQSAARTGRNPRTGEPLEIPARNGAKLTASTALKDTLNA